MVMITIYYIASRGKTQMLHHGLRTRTKPNLSMFFLVRMFQVSIARISNRKRD